MSAYMAKAKAKAKAAHPDWPLCHGEARDEVCGCVLDRIERELQRRHGMEEKPRKKPHVTLDECVDSGFRPARIVHEIAEIQRIYPEPKTALINWIEQNWDNIESYVFVALEKSGETMTIYDVDSRMEAFGLLAIAGRGEFEKTRNKVRGE